MTLPHSDVLSPLYAIVDVRPDSGDGSPGLDPLAQTAALLAAGVDLIQLRAKHLTVRDTYELARAMGEKIHAAGARFAVNDRPDIARAVDADVLHLGQDDIPPSAARTMFHGIIGLSTHDIRQVRQAMEEPVDYIGFGPVFTTVSKANPDPVTGLHGLVEAVGASRVPVVGIGGIGLSEAEAVLGTGAASVAVIGALQAATRDDVIVQAEILLDRCLNAMVRNGGANS